MFRKFALNCAISARKGAPNDGTGLGEVKAFPNAHSRSKQNSDAMGMFYQWGRKDPFAFATSSLHNGGGGIDDKAFYGKYPVKIYNNKLELVYQMDSGSSNYGKTPAGGVINQGRNANSMIETIKKPNIFYGNMGPVISQVDQNKELWDYYWTSYSRGTDGNTSKKIWHNTYLDGYLVLRTKSIFDPCPYGYRTPTNGTYSSLSLTENWVQYSYAGGAVLINSWFSPAGYRTPYFSAVGYRNFFVSSTVCSSSQLTSFLFQTLAFRPAHKFEFSFAISVRCIEGDTAHKCKILVLN